MVPTLSAIHVYPIKSCRAVSLDHAEVSTTGLRGDRLYQVVDTDGNPLTQRHTPALATIQPVPVDGGLRVEADGRSLLEVATPHANDTTVNSLLGVPVEAADAGDAAAAWFSDVLGVRARLVAMTGASTHRLPVPDVDMQLSWADAAAVHVASTASLDWLNARAIEPFGMERFRPNLTVDGADAWSEDTWRDVTIGDARLGYGFAWPRCAIPQTDQMTGERHAEPAKVLRQFRWCSEAPSVPELLRPLFEGNALFGLGCSIGPVGAVVSVGDAVTVRDTGDRVIPPPV